MVSRFETLSRAPWAGLWAGPCAWAVSTQLNYAITPWVCAHKIPLVPIFALVLAAIALGGAFLSWRAWNSPAADATEVRAGILEAPRQLLAVGGVLVGAFFALVILVHGAAGLVLNGCER
jgi:hypothetical protein